MATMFFGQYLLAKGVIDRTALLDALERQRKSNLSLPELAVQEGMMDRNRAEAALAMYRMSDESMETILSVTGGLDQDQVQRLQNKQRASWLRIGAALVEGGHLSEEEIAVNLADFQSLASASDQQIRDALKDLSNSDAVSACVELTTFHFGRVLGRSAKLESVTIEEDVLAEGRQRFSQRIVGDGDFTIAVDLPPALISATAKGMLGFEVEPGSDAEADAVCEVINLIGGNACTRIEQSGHLLRPEPPVWSGIGVLISPVTQVVRAAVMSEDECFDIRIFDVTADGVK